MALICTGQKLTKISWCKYFGAKFSKRVRQGAQIDGLVSPAYLRKKQYSLATHPSRSWSAYPALAYLCITSLLRLRHRWSSTCACTSLHRACFSGRAFSCGAYCCAPSCSSSAYSANGAFCTSHVHTGPGCSDVGGDHLEEYVYLHEAWPQVQKWAADKKVCDKDCSS